MTFRVRVRVRVVLNMASYNYYAQSDGLDI